MGDTKNGTWNANELGGYIQREESRKSFCGVSKQIESIIAAPTPEEIHASRICTGCGEPTFPAELTRTSRGYYYDSETFCAHCKAARDRKLAIEAEVAKDGE